MWYLNAIHAICRVSARERRKKYGQPERPVDAMTGRPAVQDSGYQQPTLVSFVIAPVKDGNFFSFVYYIFGIIFLEKSQFNIRLFPPFSFILFILLVLFLFVCFWWCFISFVIFE